jgi:hypothetical protein
MGPDHTLRNFSWTLFQFIPPHLSLAIQVQAYATICIISIPKGLLILRISTENPHLYIRFSLGEADEWVARNTTTAFIIAFGKCYLMGPLI